MQRQHRTPQVPVRCVVMDQVFARFWVGGVASYTVIQCVVAGGRRRIRARINVVPIVKRIATRTPLHVSDNESEIEHVVRHFGVRMEIRQPAQFLCRGRIRM